MKRVRGDLLGEPGDGLSYFEGQPFSGIAYFPSPAGWVRSESMFRDGLQWGPAKGRYGPDQLEYACFFFDGALHGPYREWHPNGRLAAEHIYEFGITLSEDNWDEQGNLLERYRLQESDPDYRSLLVRRKAYAPAPGEPEDEYRHPKLESA